MHIQIFKSQADLINWALDVGKRSGFVIVTKTSTSGSPGNKNPQLTLGCARIGCYRKNPKTKDGRSTKKRITGTGSNKCTLKGKLLGGKDEWMLVVACGVHNHPLADHLEGHSFAAR